METKSVAHLNGLLLQIWDMDRGLLKGYKSAWQMKRFGFERTSFASVGSWDGMDCFL